MYNENTLMNLQKERDHMYNPRYYANRVAQILGTSLDMTGKIEHDPLAFLSSFLSKKYDTSATAAQLIDSFDEKFAKYKNVPLCSWNEEDAKQLVEDLKTIYSE